MAQYHKMPFEVFESFYMCWGEKWLYASKRFGSLMRKGHSPPWKDPGHVPQESGRLLGA